MSKEDFISWVGAWLIRALALTMRIRIEDHSGIFEKPGGKPAIGAFWHNRMLVMPIFFQRCYRGRKGLVVLTSPSKDGSLLAAFMRRFGIGAVRGSSSRRGVEALRELSNVLAGGRDVVITPDGPRGPCYQLGPGIVYLAQSMGLPVVPIHVAYSRCVRLKSWDRFMIPLPFSSATITLGAQHVVKPTESDAEFEAERMRLEQMMQPEEK